MTVVLASLAAGLTPADLPRSHPAITPDAVSAALASAADLAAERVMPLPPAA